MGEFKLRGRLARSRMGVEVSRERLAEPIDKLDRGLASSRRTTIATSPSGLFSALKAAIEAAVDAAVDAVIAANADAVEKYWGGKTALLGFFVGQVMKAMKVKGNPGLLYEVVKRKLEG